MKNKVVVVGTGLFSEVAKDYFNEFSHYEVVAFSCHEQYKTGDTYSGLPLISLEQLSENYSPDNYSVFVAIGYGKMNKMRQSVFEEVKSIGYQCVNFIHPNVKIWDSTEIGENVFIFEDNTIQPYTKIGNNTILWSGNHIGHHSTIGEHCFIASHVVVSGSCSIGNNTFIGVNATLHDSINIGRECLIGAGAIIAKDAYDKQVFVPKSTTVYRKDSSEIGF